MLRKTEQWVTSWCIADDSGTLKTTYYQLALATLALCVEKSLEVEDASILLAKAALANDLETGGHFSVGKENPILLPFLFLPPSR